MAHLCEVTLITAQSFDDRLILGCDKVFESIRIAVGGDFETEMIIPSEVA